MKKTLLNFALLVFALGIVVLQTPAQTAPAMTPIDQPPKVGDWAPDFTLPSSPKLTPLKLSDLRGKRKILLAFYVFDFTGG